MLIDEFPTLSNLTVSVQFNILCQSSSPLTFSPAWENNCLVSAARMSASCAVLSRGWPCFLA